MGWSDTGDGRCGLQRNRTERDMVRAGLNVSCWGLRIVLKKIELQNFAIKDVAYGSGS